MHGTLEKNNIFEKIKCTHFCLLSHKNQANVSYLVIVTQKSINCNMDRRISQLTMAFCDIMAFYSITEVEIVLDLGFTENLNIFVTIFNALP